MITILKSVDAKYLAQCSGLPIFIVSSNFPIRQLTKVFKKFETPSCIILDEVEKNWNTEHMLEFLDGIEKTCKTLVLMTCNDLGRVSQYMQDRCSRIRYLRKYTVKDNYEFLPFLLEQYEVANKEEVTNFITNRMKLPSIDNMLALIKEVKLLEDEKYTVEMVAKFMNVEIIGETKLPETPKEELKEELKQCVEEPSFDFETDLNWEVEPCCCAA